MRVKRLGGHLTNREVSISAEMTWVCEDAVPKAVPPEHAQTFFHASAPSVPSSPNALPLLCPVCSRWNTISPQVPTERLQSHGRPYLGQQKC